jgi:hypothetical protein
MTHHCAHEHDVVAAVLSRRWDAADETLKHHAAGCEICRDVVAVADVLSADQERSRYEVRVPAAGQIWWRSAVRARLEAAQSAARPMTWLHGIAGACALGLAWALMGVAWPSIREMVAWLATLTLGADSRLGDGLSVVTAMLQKSLPLAFVVAACLVLAPIVALYFALADDGGGLTNGDPHR